MPLRNEMLNVVRSGFLFSLSTARIANFCHLLAWSFFDETRCLTPDPFTRNLSVVMRCFWRKLHKFDMERLDFNKNAMIHNEVLSRN